MKEPSGVPFAPAGENAAVGARAGEIRNGASTYSERSIRNLPGRGKHFCTWALVHARIGDGFGSGSLGAPRPVLECRHGFTSRITEGQARRLFAPYAEPPSRITEESEP